MENKNFRIMLGMLILFLICYALLYCNRGEKKMFIHSVNNDSIYKVIAEKEKLNIEAFKTNKLLAIKLDSLSKVKAKVVHHYHTTYDSLIINDTSCVGSLNVLYKECNKVNKVNDSIISDKTKQVANLITITNNQHNIIDIQRFKTTNDSITMLDLKESFKVQKKRNIVRVIVGVCVGLIGGLIIK